MKLPSIQQSKRSTSLASPAEIIACLFPSFGTSGKDIPSYDSSSHMFITEQYQTASGNRHITYVAPGVNLLVEAVRVHHHSWTMLGSVRLMTYDGREMKVIKSFDWPLSTYYNESLLLSKVKELASDYVLENLPGGAGSQEEEIKSAVDTMVTELFSTSYSLLPQECFDTLRAYCAQKNVCLDYVTI